MSQRLDRPTDLTDLTLAPVALALSRRLGELGEMSPGDVYRTVALSTDHDPVPGRRGELLIETLGRDLDVGAWELTWSPSGLQVKHHDHVLVLGITPSLRAFLGEDGAP